MKTSNDLVGSLKDHPVKRGVDGAAVVYEGSWSYDGLTKKVFIFAIGKRA